ncbi:MAG: hypothetical protein AAF587_34245 [Bacteroidota bacterium]
MHILQSIFLCCLLCTVTALQAQDIRSKGLINPSSYGQKKFKKAPRRIYIANFKMFFQTVGMGKAVDASAKQGTTVAQMNVELTGMDDPLLQQLTDQAYQAFVEDLTDKGFEMIGANEAASIKYYQGWTLQEGGTLNHKQLEGFAMGTPTDFNYFIRKETKTGKERGGNYAVMDQTPKISKQLGDAIVVDVAFVFPFTEFYAKKAKLGSKLTIDARIGLQLRHSITGPGNANKGGLQRGALAAQTHINFVYGNPAGLAALGVHKVALKEAVYSDRSIFADASFQTITSASPNWKVSEIITQSTTCDAKAYAEEVLRLTDQFIRLSLDQFYGYALKK